MPDGPPPNSRPDDRDASSELQAGIEQVGKVLGGVLTGLLGSRSTGIKPTDGPILGKGADEKLHELGDRVGRVLNAAGQHLSEDPSHPAKALERSWTDRDAPVDVDDGDTPLSVGLRAFAKGLSRTTESLLDQIAPPDLGLEE